MTYDIAKRGHRISLNVIVLAILGISRVQAQSFADFLSQGQLMLDTRYRYEGVDQYGFANDADANTVRERLGYESISFWNLQALAEIQSTQHWPAPGFEDTEFGVFMEPRGRTWRDGSSHESSSLRR